MCEESVGKWGLYIYDDFLQSKSIVTMLLDVCSHTSIVMTVFMQYLQYLNTENIGESILVNTRAMSRMNT